MTHHHFHYHPASPWKPSPLPHDHHIHRRITFHLSSFGGFHKWRYPKMDSLQFIVEHPTKTDELGVPPFQEPPFDLHTRPIKMGDLGHPHIHQRHVTWLAIALVSPATVRTWVSQTLAVIKTEKLQQELWPSDVIYLKFGDSKLSVFTCESVSQHMMFALLQTSCFWRQ